MAKGKTLLSFDEKLALVQAVKRAPVAFIEPPKRGRTVESIPWEDSFDLELFRRNVGRDGAVLDMLTGGETEEETEKMNGALCRSIQNRLVTVFPTERWIVSAHDGSIFLRHQGTKAEKTPAVK